MAMEDLELTRCPGPGAFWIRLHRWPMCTVTLRSWRPAYMDVIRDSIEKPSG